LLEPARKGWKDYLEHGKRFTEDFPDRIEDMSMEDSAILIDLKHVNTSILQESAEFEKPEVK